MHSDIEEFYIKNRTKLLRRCNSVSTLWGEDILHDAFVSALKYYRAEEVDDIPKWFSRVLTNSIRDHLSREKGFNYDELDEFSYMGATCHIIDKETINEILNRIRAKKDEGHKQVLLMYFQKQYSILEIGKLVPYTYKNVTAIIGRFKKELRIKYGDLYF